MINVIRGELTKKRKDIAEVRKQIKDKVHNSPSQLTVFRRRKKILLKEIRDLERQYDSLNPENKL